jgi:hypothetical protein
LPYSRIAGAATARSNHAAILAALSGTGFDRDGQRINDRTVKSCIRHGFAEPWFENPIKPDWLVCKLTDKGRGALNAAA